MMRFIDLFAGAGGLSEGFIRAGFKPIAHVEMDRAACYTLRTRTAYHYLKKNRKGHIYEAYLRGQINRHELYASIPSKILRSVINEEIDDESIQRIFEAIDILNDEHEIDAIVGGPPCQAYSLVGRARDKDSILRAIKNNAFWNCYAG